MIRGAHKEDLRMVGEAVEKREELRDGPVRHARFQAVHAPADHVELINKNHYWARRGRRISKRVVATRQERVLIHADRFLKQIPESCGAHADEGLVKLGRVQLVIHTADLIAEDAGELGLP